jgi:2-polyprenyl-6-methoxyphenol hydroxylase-like FAD-dependent oxidoreductase
MLLEEHMDFDRDFRGDSIHPSVMEIMDEIGLADRLLQLDHTRVDVLPVQTAKGMATLADFRRLKTRFRLPRKPEDPIESGGRLGRGHFLVMLNRGDQWQMGYAIPKGGYKEIHAAGLEKLRQAIAELLPEFADRMEYIKEWKQVSVLSVESSRLRRWYRPGLLLIGDAAHVMSPVGGVGINYAIQDAVVAANVLGDDLKLGKVRLHDLAEVQRQREWSTRIIQGFQNLLQKQVLAKVLKSDEPLTISPIFLFLIRLPVIRDLPAKFIGFGPWPAHVKQ